ncbi:rod shape-determining protein MreC [Candidatus Vecturithrix granuli]|uniref:Cell shape-determining protein MreC n=1 Tax=Vecturithrix granuli TaxID=1499967 RepID=A0A081C5V3_VECG1|nr:rod shape-determining protein MreC [Candidatus Vecturithrix granuli]
MLNLLTRYRHISLFLLFLFISMTLLSLHQSPETLIKPSNIMERGMLLILEPFQSMVTAVTMQFQRIWDGYIALIQLSEENQRLREEIQQLRAEKNRYIEDALAYERLKGTVDLVETRQFSTILARVIGIDASNHSHTILVNRGSDDGVQESWPVITLDGIVGVTASVAKRSSKILLMTDPNCNVAALIQRTRDQGIVGGLGRKDAYTMKYVNRRALIREGGIYRLTDQSLAQLLNEEIPGFRLTDQVFEQLRQNAIPEDILVILEELKDQSFPHHKAFIKALEDILGKEQAEWYTPFIVQYAQTDVLMTLRQLKDQDFSTKTDFLKALETTIGQETAQKYQQSILKHAEEEETVISSGLGGIFPKGLLVGTVSKVGKQDYGLFQDIEVTPSVDFSKLEEVLIIRRDEQDTTVFTTP